MSNLNPEKWHRPRADRPPRRSYLEFYPAWQLYVFAGTILFWIITGTFG